MLLAELKQQTDRIFEPEVLKVPDPQIIFKDRIAACLEANLLKQARMVEFDMRRDQAARMGFKELSEEKMCELLMGKPHTARVASGQPRQKNEWTWDHEKQADSTKAGWGASPTDFIRRERVYGYPREVWRCRFGKLDYLKVQIPYGVILRMAEIKKLNLFNAFHVMAPLAAWERNQALDPIIVASIWHIEPVNSNRQVEQSAHFFVAQW